MINIGVVLYILFAHWVADFIFQTDKMAQGKSKNNKDLISHTITYSFIVWAFMIILLPGLYCILFGGITFVCHTITDYFTSRLNKKLIPQREILASYPDYFKYKSDSWHNFFVSVGFDQFLHFTQLLLTYYILS